MMAYRHVQKFLIGAKCFESKRNGVVRLRLRLFHSSGETQEEVLPIEWYEKVFPKITELTCQLKHVDMIDGRLVNVNDGSVIVDEDIQNKMHTLKSLVRFFVGSPSVQQKVSENVKGLLVDGKCRNPGASFSKSSEREPMVVDSLSKVSNFLNVSAQQRKVVRFTICQQVTQHRIWRGALEEILNDLRSEMDLLNYNCLGKGDNMGYQIVSSCLKFLSDMDTLSDHDSTSWMRLAPPKHVGSPPNCGGWEDVLEMFHDLIQCLKSEKWSVHHVGKLEAMKEGLSQIKDVSIDKSLGYKEVRHQESLVQKKLSNTLGHSSRCLFTLLLYYLYGHVRDMEVDIRGGIYGDGENAFLLSMGRILTSDEEEMVWSGMKQLDRALRLFKFVWEIAGMKGVLELQGHLWCVGAKDRTLTFRGTLFFVHGISL
ncbi:EXOSOME COMPLEX EXONUCLEASE [Salix koriyanagi]|uniref:EXOSOME COMPLEX EXONUCLEASE n=1 Tax=Salix koriyanagi TaxID=2511006 RepID=A0A9Q0VB30_9ROSI|nr:EXOSOME COMPLEX EXONUCLEASE [Salix koriyanagi]